MIVTHVCFLSLDRRHRHRTMAGMADVCVGVVCALHLLAHRVQELRLQLVVPLLLVPISSRSISSSTDGRSGASPAGSSTSASNRGTTTGHCKTKRPPRRVSSKVAPSKRRRLCLPAWMSVSMPLSIHREPFNIGRFTLPTVKPTRSSSS